MGIRFSRQQLSTAVASAGIIGLGLLAVGCGTAAPTTSNTSGNTATPLTVWQTDLAQETMDTTVGSFKTAATNITTKKVDPAQFEWLTLNKMAAQTGPDVLMLPNDWLQDHKDKFVTIPNDWIKPDAKNTSLPKNTTEYFQQNYYDFLNTDLLSTNGAIGFPGPVIPLKLFINNKVFAAANQRWQDALRNSSDDARRQSIQKTLGKPIVTWDDFVAAEQLITQRNGNTITVSGAALGTAQNVEWSGDILQLMTMQQGGKIVDATKLIALFQSYIKGPDGQIKYPGRDALTFYTSFANPNSPNYSWNTSLGSAEAAFLAGKTAMIFDYGTFENTIKQKARDTVDLTVSAVPQLTADAQAVDFVRYYVLAVPKGSAQRSKGALLAQKLTSDAISALVQGLPESISPKKVKQSEANADQLPLFTALPIFKKHHTEFDGAYRDMIDDVSLRGQTIENSVNNAADKITTILQRASDY